MSAQLLKKTLECTTLKRCSFPLARLVQSRSYSEYDNFQARKPDMMTVSQKDLSNSKKKVKTIEITEPEQVSLVSGIPEEHIKERLVRIYRTPKNAMQSGTDNVDVWEIEFETRSRWENPLMGWTSTGDPQSNIKLQFNDKEDAIRFANKYGYQWFVESEKKVVPRAKSYAFNFSWNKRTRVSTK